MADTLGCRIDWWPYIAPPLARPPAPRADDDRGTRHRRVRNRLIVGDLERHAAARGHELLDPHLGCDPTPAHLGLLWAKHQGDPRDYLRALADGFWTGSLALDDLHGIEGVLREAGFATDGFTAFVSGEGSRELAASAARLADLGLFAVPAYRVDDEVFYGRQHLPMIRWRLTGERGPVPI
jgi:2-hydroxychromene-2-carboxylate isomerase